MNASLLALTSATSAASAATPSANGSDTAIAEGCECSSPFAELLDVASEQQWQALAGSSDAETEESLSEEAEPAPEIAESEEAVLPISLAAALTETLLPVTEGGQDKVVEAIEPTATDTDPLQLNHAVEAAVFSLAAATSQDDEGEPVEAPQLPIVDLPRAGKSLPLWAMARAPTEHVPAAEPASPGITEVVTEQALPEGWQSLLDNVGKLNQGKLGAELPAQASRTAIEPLLSLSTTSFAEPAKLAASVDAVPGITLRSPHFATLLGNQVLWQAKVGNSQAEIRLDPPELGPIDVRISQSDNETHLHFVVGHATTRDQLEQAMPRLRELFSQGGLQLGQVEVEQGRRDNPSGQPARHADGMGNKREEEPVTSEFSSRPRLLGNSLIDDYA